MRIIVSDEVLKPAPVQGFGCLLAGLAAPLAAQSGRSSDLRSVPWAQVRIGRGRWGEG